MPSEVSASTASIIKFFSPLQSLADLETALQKQEVEQQQKVSAIVPDEKTQKELEKKVAKNKKSKFIPFRLLCNTSFVYSVLLLGKICYEM
jgi:hypothetical protein